MRAKKLTVCALLTAAALVLSRLEALLPAFLPVPGFKPGLANIVTLFALYALGARATALIFLARLLLGALFSANPASLLFSLAGAFCAFAAMALAQRSARLSPYGASVLGAAAHNTGQIMAAMVILDTRSVLVWLPALLVLSIPAGLFSGFIADRLLRYYRKIAP
jgi:heptaprenyl diphosphate synthase